MGLKPPVHGGDAHSRLLQRGKLSVLTNEEKRQLLNSQEKIDSAFANLEQILLLAENPLKALTMNDMQEHTADHVLEQCNGLSESLDDLGIEKILKKAD